MGVKIDVSMLGWRLGKARIQSSTVIYPLQASSPAMAPRLFHLFFCLSDGAKDCRKSALGLFPMHTPTLPNSKGLEKLRSEG